MMNGENESICKVLDYESKTNPIMCIKTYDIKEKEMALNHMLKKGWVCVQNDVCNIEYRICFILTFADKETATSFKV